ncbi:transcription factor EMB1444 [Vigna unguiculata]|uniref:transcription factor EMB1444 n=1 Tax=Vigna unguiculata TaxID=3917 RepID=UPI001016B134|nr:transcription factor EMB1444 [Vigna unguiculata]
MAMVEPHDVTSVRNKLKTLCAVNGCSYVILWRIHPQNTLMLRMEDVYCEDQLGEEIVNTVPQFHSLGEGIVGHAALTGKHRWVESDGQMCEDDFGLHPQFLSGIKTVVMISVKAWGVVQFGSRKKILDRVKFVEQTERLLRGIEDEGLDLYLDCENLYDWNLKCVDSENSEMVLGNSCSYPSLEDSFPSMDMILVEEGTTPMHGFSYLCDQAVEAEAVFEHHIGCPTDIPHSDLGHLLAHSDHSIYGTVTSWDESLGFNSPSFGLIGIDDVPFTCQTEHNTSITAMHCSEDSFLGSMRQYLKVIKRKKYCQSHRKE